MFGFDVILLFFFFFFNDTATTEIYTLSLHDALPISRGLSVLPPLRAGQRADHAGVPFGLDLDQAVAGTWRDRKSTRLNSSHGYISYAVFCLKKKKRYQRYINLSRASSIAVADQSSDL